MNIRVITFILLLLAAGFSACQEEPAAENPDAGQAVFTSAGSDSIVLNKNQMEMAGIRLGRPERRQISSYIECTGTVEVPPQNLVSVYSPVKGFVQSVSHLPGQYVKKGTLLTTLSHPELVRLQRDFLESRSRLRAVEQDYRRKDTLARQEAASQRALDQARAEFEMEQARFRGLKAELDLIGFATEKLLETGEIQSKLAIYAPVSGYMNIVNVNHGKLISPDELMYEIIDNDHIHLELQAYAKDLPKIREGQQIEATLPGSGETFEAKVHLIGKMIDPETKTALVHGHFMDESVAITPGTFMHAHIYGGGTDVWAVPSSAVVREGAQASVFVEHGMGFKKIPVTTGETDGNFVAVEGLELEDGQRIAIEGAYYINGSIEGEE